MGLRSVTLAEAAKFVRLQWALGPMERVHIHLEGEPGSGKTKSIEQLNGCYTVTFPASIENEDLATGPMAPDLINSRVELLLAPRQAELFSLAEQHPNSPIIMLIDEIAAADHKVQQAYAPAIYDRVLCGRPLPDNVITVSTGNAKKHFAGNTSVLAQIPNRMACFQIKSSSEEWLGWSMSQSTIYPSLEETDVIFE